ncbi:MAG: hypothetical protein RBR78_00010 [Flavobacteriaceae bacterium]|jgi:hypothetical protein|nr:hypothetical protein [Flavobacteriaceae bacterium]
MKNTGIYISGLGQSFHKENVLKYAERFKNELLFNDKGNSFELKSEIINYSVNNTAKVVRIVKNTNKSADEVVYTFYEFEYHELLTKRFKSQNILVKNLILFWLVAKKLPQLFKRIFLHDHYNRPYLSFYAFFILAFVSLAVLLLIPATIDMVSGFHGAKKILEFFEKITGEFHPVIKSIYKWTVPFTTVILLTVPESKTIVTSIATEFACADRYLNDGIQSQVILGNLDMLFEYIAENEPDSKIHFHCYSFGSLIAMDFLFPLGNIPSTNTRLLSDTLITIGNPYEFINSYYSKYYLNRDLTMEQKLKWINIYSISDALSSNFRNDPTRGESLFGIPKSTLRPYNMNYEISADKSQNFINFITMDGIRMHRLYWDTDSNGQSCVRLLYHRLQELKILSL